MSKSLDKYCHVDKDLPDTPDGVTNSNQSDDSAADTKLVPNVNSMASSLLIVNFFLSLSRLASLIIVRLV